MRYTQLKTGLTLLFAMAFFFSSAAAQSKQPGNQPDNQPINQENHPHVYAQLTEARFDLKDFNYPALNGERVKLSDIAKGKKLILVHYFAAWCHNSNYDVETINELYEKYRDRGFAVIGVCEYSTRDELAQFIEKHKPSYPICIEGDEKKRDRKGTSHYAYRKKASDDRLWGTPFNILIVPEELNLKEEIAATRMRVANGELIKTEFEDIIRENLSKIR